MNSVGLFKAMLEAGDAEEIAWRALDGTRWIRDYDRSAEVAAWLDAHDVREAAYKAQEHEVEAREAAAREAGLYDTEVGYCG